MALKIYNTLTRKKEKFQPILNGKVNMFVCGPTVYDFAHIGHARTYIFFDVFCKFLKKLGYKVTYLQNITDIDDKIINRANLEGLHFRAISRKFEKEYKKDMRSLGISSVDIYARASDFIPEIIKQVKRLINKGFAYVQDGSVYFKVKKFPKYGILSRQRLNKLKPFEAGDKKDPLDFALWKASKPGEPSWKSPWGPGRPGWHIEDTAITEFFFGPQYDVHGGGIDLIFPHHECEIAQQEAASGISPFVRYWMHTGHLKVKGEKMSKSLGNFITIREMLTLASKEAFRLLVLSCHWRKPIDYSENILTQAKTAAQKLSEFYIKVKTYKSNKKVSWPKNKISQLEKLINKFYYFLEDDINTPSAIACIFKIISIVNPDIEKGALPNEISKKIKEFLEDTDSILGIIEKPKRIKIPKNIKNLIKKREELRKLKKWHEADRIRRKINQAGWIVEDTPFGPRVKKK
jgi:cysteinyl-tRNA synthetase